MSEKLTIESPCISICTMDEMSGFCLGCYRTLAEIQDWWDFDNTEKKNIVEKASQRAASLFES